MDDTTAAVRPGETAVAATTGSDAAARPAIPPAPPDRLRDALLDSRQRWRDLVIQAADFAFETDEWGRFVFVVPDPALGWSASALVGEPAEQLLPDGAEQSGFNPFRTAVAVRRRRTWLKRGDGGIAALLVAAAPLLDPQGRLVGARGIGLDVTEYDGREAQVAAALRRGEVVDHILWRMGQEVLAPRMMQAALDALVNALGRRARRSCWYPQMPATPCWRIRPAVAPLSSRMPPPASSSAVRAGRPAPLTATAF